MATCKRLTIFTKPFLKSGFLTDINVKNITNYGNKYFIVEEQVHKGKIFLKVYGNKYVNITNGNETFDSYLNFENCTIINKLKISIEQL